MRSHLHHGAADLDPAAEDLQPYNSIRLGLALNYSVFYYEVKSDIPKACKLAEEALESAKQNIDNMDNEDARDALSRKEGKEALNYANQLLNHCTDAIKFISFKMESLILLKRVPEAIDFSTKIQNQFIDSPEFLYWRGKLMICNGNIEMGKKFIREALNKDPDNVKLQRAWKNITRMDKLK